MAYLEGVYWDLDGTIANTELEAHLPAFNQAFKFFNLNWFWDEKTYIDLLKVNGGKNRISYFAEKKKESISEDLIIDIHKKKQFFYLDLLNQGKVSLKRGVLRLIRELNQRDVKQFIVTSSSRIQVDTLVNKLVIGFQPFEFFICSEDVNLHKPHGLPYEKAVELSGINKINSLVFEDSCVGLRSSTAAGLRTICIKTNIPIDFGKYKLSCLIDSLGDQDNPTDFLIGSSYNSQFIDYKYLNNFINSY